MTWILAFLVVALTGLHFAASFPSSAFTAAHADVTVDTFIRTYAGDVDFLGPCLRALDHFSGKLFRALHIVVPQKQLPFLDYLERKRSVPALPCAYPFWSPCVDECVYVPSCSRPPTSSSTVQIGTAPGGLLSGT